MFWQADKRTLFERKITESIFVWRQQAKREAQISNLIMADLSHVRLKNNDGHIWSRIGRKVGHVLEPEQRKTRETYYASILFDIART